MRCRLLNAKGVEEFHEYILPSYSTVYMETMPRDHKGAHDGYRQIQGSSRLTLVGHLMLFQDEGVSGL